MKSDFLNKRQYDMIAVENGGIVQSKEDWEKENKCIIIESIKFGWFVGFGYWKDVYITGAKAHSSALLWVGSSHRAF